MVSTRSGGATASDSKAEASGEKRSSAPSRAKQPAAKKAKPDGPEDNATLEVNDEGQVGLSKGEEEAEKDDVEQDGGGVDNAKRNDGGEEKEGFTDDKKDEEDMKVEDLVEGEGKQKGENGVEEEKKEAKQQDEGEGNNGQEAAVAKEASPGGDEQKPSHGTLESGHIYFLYRPKIDAEEVESIDDVSKFHILLIPKSGKHASGHYHRVIEVGKKKLPDPGAKRQVIWGLVGAVSTDKASLKPAFGAYDYETKTRGTRHQSAARPAARGHYILHSPRDERADDPNTSRQRDYKTLLVYEITTPPPKDFGRVQEELGLEQRGAVALSVKDPEAADGGNPRAASMPREKKAHYPQHLYKLFGGRRWIAPNPVSFLDYQGGELLFLSSANDLEGRLGKDGDKVEDDLNSAAKDEQTDVDGALKELGMSKKDTEIEALEGAWA